jgi:hypothetical protein
MADDEQPEQPEEQRKDRQGREQAAALDKVTDNVSPPPAALRPLLHCFLQRSRRGRVVA